jgi:NhaP-type Na+/H+ or K+/H+ antiporter
VFILPLGCSCAVQTAYAAEALWLVLVLSALLAASRAAFVVPFSLLHNKWSAAKLSNRDIVIVWWSGLMRGAVSVALVYYYFDDAPNQMVDRQRATLIVATLMVGVWSMDRLTLMVTDMSHCARVDGPCAWDLSP